MAGDLAAEALGYLRAMLGPEVEFRPGQLEAIESVVGERSRLLLVQRTGWGKSIVYFIATRMLRDRGAGPTLIVSPLLALMLTNPVDVARVLVITQLDVSALMGYTGALFQHTFGTAVGTSVAAGALLIWCAIPLGLAGRRFLRRDF